MKKTIITISAAAVMAVAGDVRLLHRKSERKPVPECKCGGIG